MKTACRSFNVAAAAAQPQDRDAEADQRVSDSPCAPTIYSSEGGDDLRELPFAERRARLEAFIKKLNDPRIDISPLVPFENWAATDRGARRSGARAGAGLGCRSSRRRHAQAERRAYLPGRPKGPWWKWKRDPMIIDAVLMYAQRGHGKRSSFYSDYTFGVWNGEDQNWCRSARPISASPTRSFSRSTASSGAIPSTNSGRCAR